MKVPAGWAPESPNFRSITKNGTPVMPKARRLRKIVADVVGVFVGAEQLRNFAGIYAQVLPQKREVILVADVLAVLEVVAEQPFLRGVLLAVGGGEVDAAGGP